MRAQRTLLWPSLFARIAALVFLDRMEDARGEFDLASGRYPNYLHMISNFYVPWRDRVLEGVAMVSGGE